MTIMTRREQFKRRVIELNHPECASYEEALKVEEVRYDLRKMPLPSKAKALFGKAFCYFSDGARDRIRQIEKNGLPITLPRVMKALLNLELKKRNANKFCIHNEDLYCGCGMDYSALIKSGDWKLTKENGQACTAEDQSDQTIEELLKLLKLL